MPINSFQSAITALKPRRRLGSSFLEVQVAMVILSIGTIGMYSTSALQARQTGRLNTVLPEDDSKPAFNRAESDWARKLGVYATIDDKLNKEKDPKSLELQEYILDDEDKDVKFKKGKHDLFGWTKWTYFGAYLGKCRYHYSQGRVGSRVEYKFDHVEKKQYYEVFITYPSFSSLGNAIPVQIFDDNDLVAALTLNQRQPPADLSYAGKMWTSLGSYYFTDDKIKIRLLDGPNSRYYIIADAMMLRSPRPLNLLSQARTANGGATATLEVLP